MGLDVSVKNHDFSMYIDYRHWYIDTAVDTNVYDYVCVYIDV